MNKNKMKINQKGFLLIHIVIASLLLIGVSAAFYYVSNKSSKTNNLTKAGESVNNYDLDGFATIDYPCKPKRAQIIKTKDFKQVDHRCTPKGSNDADYNYYVVTIYNYDSKASYENTGSRNRACGFMDKGQLTIHGKQFKICNMFVQDGNPSNMITAVLEYPNKNAQLVFILNEPTYEDAINKLADFTNTLELK